MASFDARIDARGLGLLLVAALAGCGAGPSREQVLRSEREYDLARGLFGEQDYPGAFEHLLAAIELDPDNAEAHLLLGNLYFLRRADYERADHHFDEALRSAEVTEQRASLPSDVRNSRGVMYINIERYDDAIEVLRVAASDLLNRDAGLARTNLGWAYIETERHQEAVEVLLAAVRQSPQLCIAWYRLGEARVGLDQLEPAEQALSRGLALENPTCQNLQAAWRLRGETRARLGHYEDAVSDLERCVEIAPDTEDGQACHRTLDTTARESTDRDAVTPSAPLNEDAE